MLRYKVVQKLIFLNSYAVYVVYVIIGVSVTDAEPVYYITIKFCLWY